MWLLDWIPLWVWIALAVVGLIVAYNLLGFKGLLAAAVTAGGALAYLFGRKSGGQDEKDRQARERQKAIDAAKKVENEVGSMSAEDRRKELKTWGN